MNIEQPCFKMEDAESSMNSDRNSLADVTQVLKDFGSDLINLRECEYGFRTIRRTAACLPMPLPLLSFLVPLISQHADGYRLYMVSQIVKVARN